MLSKNKRAAIFFIITVVILSGGNSLKAQVYSDSVKYLSAAPLKDEAWVKKISGYLSKLCLEDPAFVLRNIQNIITAAENTGQDELTAELYRIRAEAFLHTGSYPKAKRDIGISLSRDPGPLQSAKSYSTLGHIYFNSGDFDSALISYNKAGEALGAKQDPVFLAGIYNNRATVYSQRGDHKQAVRELFLAAGIYEAAGNTDELAVVYNNIAGENRLQKLYAEAIKFYRKAIDMCGSGKNLQKLAFYYANLGVCYAETDSFALANEYYRKGLAMAQKAGNLFTIAQISTNLGNLLKNKGINREALVYFGRSLDICRKSGIAYGIGLNHLNISGVYENLSDYPGALRSLDSARVYFRAMKLPDEESEVFKAYSEVYRKSGNYSNAYKYIMLHNSLKDSLQKARADAQLMDIQEKYKSAQKEREILRLQSGNDKQWLIILYLLSALLASLLLQFWLWFWRRMALKEKALAALTAKNLKLELELKNRDLAEKSLNIAQLQSNSEHVMAELAGAINSAPDERNKLLRRIIRQIDADTHPDDVWKEFEFRFREYNSAFYRDMITSYPNLSPAEIRVILLLRLNFTNKEIARITRRSPRTIDFTRNAIRRKLNLAPDVNLAVFILSK